MTQTQYTYEPFGNTAASGTSSANSYQYTGRENDDTGLYYYRTRFNSTNTGRFVSEDVINKNAGLNLYAYVLDSPLTFIDPLGTTPFYGNYCGPGNYPKGPINQTDYCCMKHDFCYQQIGASSASATAPGVGACDRALCACLRNASGNIGSAYELFWNTKVRQYFHCSGQQCQGMTIFSVAF
jgi:RHS repeat-associated protein